MEIVGYLKAHRKFAFREPSEKGEINTLCPFHPDSAPSFSINVYSGRFLCRSASCGVRGGFPKFYKLLEDVSWSQVYAALGSSFGSSAPSEEQTREGLLPNPFARTLKRALISVPDLVPDVFLEDPLSSQISRWYLERRGITHDTSYAFGLKYVCGGPARGRIYLPYLDPLGRVVSWSSRAASHGEALRYLSSSAEPSPQQLLYGIHAIPPGRPVCVVEGPFDVLRLHSLGVPSVGLSSNSATSAQLNFLVGLGVPLRVFLDRGAEDRAAALQAELSLVVECTWIDPRLLGVKDPGEVKRPMIQAIYPELKTA